MRLSPPLPHNKETKGHKYKERRKSNYTNLGLIKKKSHVVTVTTPMSTQVQKIVDFGAWDDDGITTVSTASF